MVVQRNQEATEFERPQAEELDSWVEDYALGEIWEKKIDSVDGKRATGVTVSTAGGESDRVSVYKGDNAGLFKQGRPNDSRRSIFARWAAKSHHRETAYPSRVIVTDPDQGTGSRTTSIGSTW